MLFLMRHGEAATGAASDYDRRLTESGVRAVRRAAACLPDESLRILHSPYRRTRETAQLLTQHREVQVKQATTWLEPEVPVIAVLEQLAGIQLQEAALVLVTHNPLISLLAAELTGEVPAAVSFPTAGLARLSGEHWLPGCLDLRWETP